MLKASSSKRVLEMVFDSIKKDWWNSLFWEREVEGLPQRDQTPRHEKKAS